MTRKSEARRARVREVLARQPVEAMPAASESTPSEKEDRDSLVVRIARNVLDADRCERNRIETRRKGRWFAPPMDWRPYILEYNDNWLIGGPSSPTGAGSAGITRQLLSDNDAFRKNEKTRGLDTSPAAVSTMDNLDSQQIQAAAALCRNIYNPFVPPGYADEDLPKNASAADRDGKAVWLVQRGRMNLARLQCDINVASRAGSIDLKKWAASSLGIPKEDLEKQGITDGLVSIHKMTDIEVMRRYGNMKWHEQVVNGDMGAHVKELLFMQSLANYTNWEMLKTLQTTNLLLGAIYSHQISKDMPENTSLQDRPQGQTAP